MKKLLLNLIIILIWSIKIFSLPSINGISENSDPVRQYEKFELTINLTANYTNPYNPDTLTNGIDLWTIFTSPSGVTKRVNGFYMDTNNDGTGDSWKIRFAAGEIGQWNYVVYVKDNSGQVNSSSYTFQIITSGNKGFIRKSQINPRYFAYENGGSFWGIGHNNGWQYSNSYCPTCINNPTMATMASYGENVLSFWLNTPWRTPSEEQQRTPIENSTQGLGNYNQYSAKFIDDQIQTAEQYGIKLILQIWAHDNLRNGGCSGWSTGSWLKLSYSSLGDARDFFDDANSWEYQKKYLRYIIARWGYSRALLLWDFLVEANGTDGWCLDGSNVVETWLANMKNYFNENDPFSHPVTASLSGGWDSWGSDPKWQNGWNITGVSQIHSYEWKDDMAKVPRVIANDTQFMWNSNNQLNYIGEFGTSNSSNQPTDLHRAAWAGLCSGASLEPMLWCDNGSYINMTTQMLQQQQYLSQFVSDIDFENKINQQKICSVSGYYCWAVGSSDYAICWIFNDAGQIQSGKQLTISSFLDNTYRVKFYNTWTGATVTETDKTTNAGQLIIDIPSVAYNDIACKIYLIVPTSTPTFTATVTMTTTGSPEPTWTPTTTPSFTQTISPTATLPYARENLQWIKVYPSIVDLRTKNKGIYFVNLTKNTLIQIFNLAGELVFQEYLKNTNGTYFLDLKELSKENIYIKEKYPFSSGIYIYIVSNENEIKYGKIAIIK